MIVAPEEEILVTETLEMLGAAFTVTDACVLALAEDDLALVFGTASYADTAYVYAVEAVSPVFW